MLGSQIAPRRRGVIHICRACLRHFASQNELRSHWNSVCGPSSSTFPIPIVPLSPTAGGRIRERQSRRIALANRAGICLLCCVNMRSAIYIPCNHIVACIPCAMKASETNQRCTLCNDPYEQITKVFLS
jgi:hypothetical protein